MQIYADVTGPADEDFALGADLRARLGHRGGGRGRARTRISPRRRRAMTGLKPKIYKPNPKAHAVYRELYPLYQTIARRLRHEGMERQFVRRDEATD